MGGRSKWSKNTQSPKSTHSSVQTSLQRPPCRQNRSAGCYAHYWNALRSPFTILPRRSSSVDGASHRATATPEPSPRPHLPLQRQLPAAPQLQRQPHIAAPAHLPAPPRVHRGLRQRLHRVQRRHHRRRHHQPKTRRRQRRARGVLRRRRHVHDGCGQRQQHGRQQMPHAAVLPQPLLRVLQPRPLPAQPLAVGKAGALRGREGRGGLKAEERQLSKARSCGRLASGAARNWNPKPTRAQASGLWW